MKAIWITVFCCLSILLRGQNERCFAKLLVPEYLERDTVLLYVEGNEMENYAIRKEQLVEVAPASSKWVKRKADRNCISQNPDDCLVWCLVDIPSKFEEMGSSIEFLSEKSLLTDDFIKQKIETNQYRYEWRAIHCWNDVSRREKNTIVKTMKNEGYLKDQPDNFFSLRVMDALHQFQEDNELPIGFLNLETLDFMGIEY